MGVLDLDYLSGNWYNLQWSPWINFSDRPSFSFFPQAPGVYRVKAVGKNDLYYIGQTGRTVRERITSLITNTLQADMPFNDPHTAAPSLWVWINTDNLQFEVSATTVELPKRQRLGLESCLLWLYRCERGNSTICNFGRFHKNYSKSRNRSGGLRGSRLPESVTNPAGGSSLSPLQIKTDSSINNWMGLEWQPQQVLTQSNLSNITAEKGIYMIMNKDILYIGQSSNLKNRLKAHSNLKWDNLKPCYTYYKMPDDSLPHHLKEWENDLIGAYYYQNNRIPHFQFGG